ncbi:MAG: hypothetical protein OEY17_00395 [Nitrosopumilus sp.]|nr:hypothetical protein [Nitrosopumilus sp.]
MSFEYYILGLQHPIIQIPLEWKPFFDVLIYPLVILLSIDLALKYRKEKNPKKFLRKYWMDISMLVLIPVLSIFKFLKIGLSLAKQIKTIKMGAKAIHKTKKISKK